MSDKTKEITFMDEDVYKKIPESEKEHWVGFLMLFLGM